MKFHKITQIQITNTQIHKYTNTAYDEVPERPNMWYIFEKRIVQGYHKLYSHTIQAWTSEFCTVVRGLVFNTCKKPWFGKNECSSKLFTTACQNFTWTYISGARYFATPWQWWWWCWWWWWSTWTRRSRLPQPTSVRAGTGAGAPQKIHITISIRLRDLSQPVLPYQNELICLLQAIRLLTTMILHDYWMIPTTTNSKMSIINTECIIGINNRWIISEPSKVDDGDGVEHVQGEKTIGVNWEGGGRPAECVVTHLQQTHHHHHHHIDTLVWARTCVVESDCCSAINALQMLQCTVAVIM